MSSNVGNGEQQIANFLAGRARDQLHIRSLMRLDRFA